MIELFPAKCCEILRCGGSVWAGVVMNHHNTPANPSSSDTILWRSDWNLRKMQGKWRNGESSVLSDLLFNCTHQSSFTTDGWPLRGSSCTFSHPSLNSRTHLRTIELLMACSPYTSQSWQWISASFMFFTFKKWITDRISQAVGVSIFLNIINTQHDA